MLIYICPQLNMLLPRVVSDVLIYCCEYGTITESGEISKKAKSSPYLKHVKACLMT